MRNANEPGAADRFAVTINALLDDAMVGVVYLDRCGRIVEANTRARTILRHGDGLVERAGYLRAQVAADDARLRTLLSHMSGSGTPCTGSIAVQRSAKLPRLAVHLSPVIADGRGIVVRRATALALIVDPAVRPRIDTERVAATLGLTRAESRVAAALANGESVREIAAATKRKESSVRWLIKQIHTKLRISRNADLVRMVLVVAWGTGLWPTDHGNAEPYGT